MLAYTSRRLLMLVPVLFGMTVITFSIIHLIPETRHKLFWVKQRLKKRYLT